MINHKDKIFVAGHKGLVGSAIVRKLKSKGFKNILFSEKSKLDLTNQKKVHEFLKVLPLFLEDLSSLKFLYFLALNLP